MLTLRIPRSRPPLTLGCLHRLPTRASLRACLDAAHKLRCHDLAASRHSQVVAHCFVVPYHGSVMARPCRSTRTSHGVSDILPSSQRWGASTAQQRVAGDGADRGGESRWGRCWLLRGGACRHQRGVGASPRLQPHQSLSFVHSGSDSYAGDCGSVLMRSGGDTARRRDPTCSSFLFQHPRVVFRCVSPCPVCVLVNIRPCSAQHLSPSDVSPNTSRLRDVTRSRTNHLLSWAIRLTCRYALL